MFFPYFVYHGFNIAGAFENKESAYKLCLMNANNGYPCTIEDQFGSIVFDSNNPFK